MPGYKHPCRYCNALIDGDSRFCPLCERSWPFGGRCPACRSQVEDGWKRCNSCGIPLEGKCTDCGKTTSIIGECKECGNPMTVECKSCKNLEPFGTPECSKCNKKM